MILRDTDDVKPADSRPVGPVGHCTYCRQPIGGRHLGDCVCVQKTVVLRMTIDVVVSVPRSWEKDLVEFSYNESTRCADSTLEALGRWASQDQQNCGCSCGTAEFAMLREATEDDHKTLPVIE